MDMKDFFDSLAGYSFEDMQRKARYDSDERAASKANEETEFPSKDALDKIARQYADAKEMLDSVGEDDPDYAQLQSDFDNAEQEYLDQVNDFIVSAAPEKVKAAYDKGEKDSPDVAAWEKYVLRGTPFEEGEPDSEPKGAAVEKTTVKVDGGMPEGKKEAVAEKVAEKSAKEEVMPAEEFDKLIGREPSGEEELDDDVEAVMDLVYKLPPEKAAKILDRLNGLNLKKGEVPSDKNVKEGC